MAPLTPRQGMSGSQSNNTMGALLDTLPAEAQEQHGHHLVHGDDGNTPTENMTLHAHLQII